MKQIEQINKRVQFSSFKTTLSNIKKKKKKINNISRMIVTQYI